MIWNCIYTFVYPSVRLAFMSSPRCPSLSCKNCFTSNRQLFKTWNYSVIQFSYKYATQDFLLKCFSYLYSSSTFWYVEALKYFFNLTGLLFWYGEALQYFSHYDWSSILIWRGKKLIFLSDPSSKKTLFAVSPIYLCFLVLCIFI